MGGPKLFKNLCEMAHIWKKCQQTKYSQGCIIVTSFCNLWHGSISNSFKSQMNITLALCAWVLCSFTLWFFRCSVSFSSEFIKPTCKFLLNRVRIKEIYLHSKSAMHILSSSCSELTTILWLPPSEVARESQEKPRTLRTPKHPLAVTGNWASSNFIFYRNLQI